MRHPLKLLFFAVSIGLFGIWPVVSYADDHSHDGHTHDSGHHDNGHHDRGRSYIGVNFSVWPDNYYYSAPYYTPDDDVLVSQPVYQPVTVIQPPVTVVDQAQPAPVITTVAAINDGPDVITINIPNNKGGYTAVTLKRSGTGYTGPQGEFYTEFPKVSQLQVIYGK